MMRRARHAFALLRDAIARLPGTAGDTAMPDLDAMYVWATVHGLASALQGSVVGTLGLDAGTLAAMPGQVLSRIGTGLERTEPPSPKRPARRRPQSRVRR
jgi:hypothetical protein